MNFIHINIGAQYFVLCKTQTTNVLPYLLSDSFCIMGVKLCKRLKYFLYKIHADVMVSGDIKKYKIGLLS